MDKDVDTRFKLVTLFLKCAKHVVKENDSDLKDKLYSVIEKKRLDELAYEIKGWNSEIGVKYAVFQHDMAIQCIIRPIIFEMECFIEIVKDKYPDIISEDTDFNYDGELVGKMM